MQAVPDYQSAWSLVQIKKMEAIGIIGLYWDNGKQNGNYNDGIRV